MTLSQCETVLFAVGWAVAVLFLLVSWVTQRLKQRWRPSQFRHLWETVEAVLRSGAQ